MPTAREIQDLLPELERVPANALERQDLDFTPEVSVTPSRLSSRWPSAWRTAAGAPPCSAFTIDGSDAPQRSSAFRRTSTSTCYGRAALPDAIARLEQRVAADNPITTVEVGPFHFEYRTYPEIALREALLNAFAHRNYRLGGPVILKQYDRELHVHSPGGFIGGVSPTNVLHHQPVARNPHLVGALIRLRLVNRANLGVPRMFTAMLQEGREAPLITEAGEAVTVSFRAGAFSRAFRAFVAEQDALDHRITVDHLLVLHWLLCHPELPLDEAARLTQRPESAAREVLNELELQWGVLERGGAGRGTYWTLDPSCMRGSRRRVCPSAIGALTRRRPRRDC